MRSPFLCSLVALMLTYAQGALAQSAAPKQVWIQLETRLHLEDSMDSIETYARDLSNVNGFEIDGGWFGVAIGPHNPEQADADLQKLRAEGIIPRPSFTTTGATYGARFYPPALAAQPGTANPYGAKHGTPNRAAPRARKRDCDRTANQCRRAARPSQSLRTGDDRSREKIPATGPRLGGIL